MHKLTRSVIVVVASLSGPAFADLPKGTVVHPAYEMVDREYRADSKSLSELCGAPIDVKVDYASFKDKSKVTMISPAAYFHNYAQQAFTTACNDDAKKKAIVAKIKHIVVAQRDAIEDSSGSNDGVWELKNGTLTVGVNAHTGNIFQRAWRYLEEISKP